MSSHYYGEYKKRRREQPRLTIAQVIETLEAMLKTLSGKRYAAVTTAIEVLSLVRSEFVDGEEKNMISYPDGTCIEMPVIAHVEHTPEQMGRDK